MPTKHLFDNTEIAFKLKNDAQLERAYFLFKMISKEPLVKIGTAATKFALNLHLPVEGLIRSTVFDHFCGGVNEKDCMPVVESLQRASVYSVLDYSVEGKEEKTQFDTTMEKVLELTRFAEKKDAMPFSVFKPTGLGRLVIWQKVTEKATLTESETQEWQRIVSRYDRICQVAHDCDVVDVDRQCVLALAAVLYRSASVTRRTSSTLVLFSATFLKPSARSVTMPRSMQIWRNSVMLGLRAIASRMKSSRISIS